ncbi:NAD(P)H-dependent oxidoreductase [Aldersonia sp. NBC_00410]|jgi:multimeric flavodoxin WrbA|uniref:flavodoxin family protein n=1 Tax=Aldersonia sp. NBC_00410 TaxID=2975954 RepID=UPI002251527F|nr:NAD(P)H-dependent oxidoreductase [Aldersonia sp. NBC_00410]MCX5044129.1 NAD(P)H-dependent oxidoreductase [Aldersonia sp. NBC_00410]
MESLQALALVCTLTPSPADSSSDLLARQVLDELGKLDVDTELVRLVDHDVRPGVQRDMGPGDAWPDILEQVLAADILVVATPIWLGHMSSIAQRMLERLDAELAETDERGNPSMSGKVGVTAVVGNEDGAHKIAADMFQALNDLGFTIPAQGATYWVGEAMQGTDYKDLDGPPDPVAHSTATLALNAVHVASRLRANPYPPQPSSE